VRKGKEGAEEKREVGGEEGKEGRSGSFSFDRAA